MPNVNDDCTLLQRIIIVAKLCRYSVRGQSGDVIHVSTNDENDKLRWPSAKLLLQKVCACHINAR